MPGIFVGNFDFEHTLAGVRRPKASSLGRDLLAAFTAVALPGDAIWDAGVWDAEFGAELEGLGRTDSFCTRERDEYQVVPWGWTPDVCDLSRREGWHVEAPPPLDTVRRVNSRSFSLSLEQAADTVPRGACVVRSVAEFESAVAALDPGAKWLARAEFSMSGRERICGAGAPNAAHRGWVWNRLSRKWSSSRGCVWSRKPGFSCTLLAAVR